MFGSQAFMIAVSTLLCLAICISASPAPLKGVNRDLTPIDNLAARRDCPEGQSYGCQITFNESDDGELRLPKPRGGQEALRATGQHCGCFKDRSR